MRSALCHACAVEGAGRRRALDLDERSCQMPVACVLDAGEQGGNHGSKPPNILHLRNDSGAIGWSFGRAALSGLAGRLQHSFKTNVVSDYLPSSAFI